MAGMLKIPSDRAAHLHVDLKKIMGVEFEPIIGGKKSDDRTVYVIIEPPPPMPRENQLAIIADRYGGTYQRI